MSGVAHTSSRVFPRTCRGPGAGALSDEYSSKDLPRIPSTSTGLWGDEAMRILTEATGSPTASPIVGCPPLPVPSHRAYERVPITEAQQIAAQYRQRFRSALNALQSTKVSEQMVLNTDPLEPSHASPTSAAMQSGVSTDTQAMDAPVGALLALSQSPTMRALAKEIEATHTPHEGASPFTGSTKTERLLVPEGIVWRFCRI